MVPDAGDESSPSASTHQGRADGRPDSAFDEVAMYRVVRKAMEDAILDVIGTLLLVGTALVLVIAGASTAVNVGTPTSVVLGGLAVVFGLYLAGSALELIPPVRQWLR